MRDEERDFLDEIIEESTARNPNFPNLMDQARRNREMLAALAAERRRKRVSQTVVAAGMGTSQSAVSTLEKSASDVKLSTVEKYASTLGLAVQLRFLPLGQATREPPAVFP